MEKLNDLAAVYQTRFPELRFFQANKCVKVIGDTVYGFEFMRIRGDLRTFFAGYSLWGALRKTRFETCLFFEEVHDSRKLQVKFQLPRAERVLERLIEGAELFVKPPLFGDIEFGDFLRFVSETQKDSFFRTFGWRYVSLARLALRTASFCGKRDIAHVYLAQIVDFFDELDPKLMPAGVDYVFGGDKNWRTLLESEIELGLAGNPVVAANREILRKKGLVISDILSS